MILMPMSYTNSAGEVIDFSGALPGSRAVYRYGVTDIFNMSLEYSTVSDVITAFRSGIRKMSLTIILDGGGVEERNRFLDVISYDTRACSHGRLTAGSSYMECYVLGYDISHAHMDDLAVYDLTLVSDRPVWVRKHEVVLAYEKAEATEGLDYPHDYPFDYGHSDGPSADFVNPFALPSACDIVFPGPCFQPYMRIGSNLYQVMEDVQENGLLIVRGHGQEKDIIVRSIDGTERSVFDKGVRKPGAQIFDPVPPGKSAVAWSGTMNVSVTLYDEGLAPWWE